MIHKFTVNNNDPYFGAVTLSNPEDSRKGCCTTAPTFTYACTGCNELKSEIRALKNKLAIDSIESARIGDHLRSQLANLKKELTQVEKMHAAQAQTIIEKNAQLVEANKNSLEFPKRMVDQFGRTFPEYHELVKQQDSTIRRLDTELVAATKSLADLKTRNLDPEPHKLKAAILTMQKQIDELKVALENEQKDHDNDNGTWIARYEYDLGKKNNEITTLKHENTNIKNHYCCECDSKLVPRNEETERLREEVRIRQVKIEDQNRIIGGKQEDINKLKIALNTAKAKQVLELKPAKKVMKEYEDKIRRLIDVANSKDSIIAGLQDSLRIGKKQIW